MKERRGDLMLKKIPPIISPELMYMLMKMGHGDEILLAAGYLEGI